MTGKPWRLGMLAVGAAGAAAAASAHHSFAMFDRDKKVTLSGTVRTWQWTNPHTWLWIYVADKTGQRQVWGLEGAAPGELARQGWSRQSLKPGDKVTLTVSPLRDGRNGGSFSQVTLADGTVLGAKAPGQ